MDFIPSSRRLLLSKTHTLAAKACLHTTDGGIALLVHRLLPPSPHPNDRETPNDLPLRVYVPMLMRPWVLHTCNTTSLYHAGIARTLSLLVRFLWWIAMDISTRWWLRRCLDCQSRTTSP